MMMSIVNKQKTNRLYCGLIGFSGKTNFDKEKINLLMLWNSFERGKDATGIYTPKNGLVKFLIRIMSVSNVRIKRCFFKNKNSGKF